jgi:hypothetical protein
MKIVAAYFRELYQASLAGWNRFWFTPTDPATLCLIRVLAGGMLLYTHLVWTIGLNDFLGPGGWLSAEAVRSFQRNSAYTWSYFWLLDSHPLRWLAHLAALGVFASLMVGWFSRTASVLAYLATVSYVHRLPGSLFGLDQINGLLAMYLMVGPSGARYSVDRWLRLHKAGAMRGQADVVQPSVSANIAIRLIQLHMCVIYFFAGISKLQGPAWWNGSALWGAVANLEYQSLDMTWLAAWPLTIAAMTHVTVLWELSYPALVWPRFTRPLMLSLAAPLHLGIALFLGMPTFGLVMLIGNAAFVSPWLVRLVFERRVETAVPMQPSEIWLPKAASRKGRAGERALASHVE